MQLSVFYSHIAQAAEKEHKPVSTLLPRVRAMGYSMVELDFDEVRKNPAIPSDLKKAGLGISSMPCFFRFDEGPMEERVHALIDLAASFGIRKIMPIPGFYPEKEEARGAALDRMMSGMQRLCRKAAEAGLTVSIEDFDNALSPIRDSNGMIQFLDEIENLKVTFDTGNFPFAGEDVLTAFEKLKDRIVHVHLKDRAAETHYGRALLTALDGTPLCSCPVGGGFLPIDKIIDRLRGIGYQGALTAEHFGAEDQIDCMEKSAAYILKCLEK